MSLWLEVDLCDTENNIMNIGATVISIAAQLQFIFLIIKNIYTYSSPGPVRRCYTVFYLFSCVPVFVTEWLCTFRMSTAFYYL